MDAGARLIRTLFLAFVVAAIAAPVIASFAIGIQQGIHAPPYVATIFAIVLAATLGVVLHMVIASIDMTQGTASRPGRFALKNIFDAGASIIMGRAFLSAHRTQKAGWSALRRCSRPGVMTAALAGLLMSAAMAMGWSTLSTLALGLVTIAAIAMFSIILFGGAAAFIGMSHDTRWSGTNAITAAVTNGTSPMTRTVSFLAAARDKVDAVGATVAGQASSAAIRALGENFPGAGTQLSAAA